MSNIIGRKNAYYSALVYNSTQGDILAQTDVALQYPLLQVSSDYQVALNKSTTDLSTIPLTQYNIPLKK